MPVERSGKFAETILVRDMVPGQIGEVVQSLVDCYYGKIVQRLTHNMLVEIGGNSTWSDISNMSNFRVRILEDGETLTIRKNQ